MSEPRKTKDMKEWELLEEQFRLERIAIFMSYAKTEFEPDGIDQDIADNENERKKIRDEVKDRKDKKNREQKS